MPDEPHKARLWPLTLLGALTVAGAAVAVTVTFTARLDPAIDGLLRAGAAIAASGYTILSVEWRSRQRDHQTQMMLARIAEVITGLAGEVAALRVEVDQPTQLPQPRTRPIVRE